MAATHSSHLLTTVLIVDDDARTRAGYRDVLLSAGFDVIAAYNGLHALKLMEQGELPDIIVLGLGPPHQGGLDLYDELLAHAEKSLIPVVVLSGIDLSPQQQARFPFLLQRPVATQALVFAVDNALRRAFGGGRDVGA